MLPAPRLPSADQLVQRLQWDDLDLVHLRRLVEMARDEDLAGLGLRRRPVRAGDISTASVAGAPRQGAAALVAREPLIVCGLPLVPLILSAFGGRVSAQFCARDGAAVAAGGLLATLHGEPRVLLTAERTLLNFLQRLSGVATHTRRHVAALGRSRTRLLDTRKTTPGYRMLEKYAVACGGGWNHRLGLFDRVMLKDNHLSLLGLGWKGPTIADAHDRGVASGLAFTQNRPVARLAAAVAEARRSAPGLPVEIEVDHPRQIPAVLSAGVDVVLLDNFSVPQLRGAVARISGRAFTEASGGVTLKTLPRLARLGLDFVSTGALVHHSVWVDIGLDWRA
ncbi:MAG TPA: nicotinate-nucleotide diphosphorylase [Opitutaceae bacterium]|nr:nicotinate-nucleotide diphosphorylase [Opitutaceae bacterium]